MKVLLTSHEMKEADRGTIEKMRMPSLVLMERAALVVSNLIREKVSKDRGGILVVCGTGNNGGDGVAIARQLHLRGYRARVLLAGPQEKWTPELTRQKEIAENYLVPFVTEENASFANASVVVDALLGIGITRDLEGDYAALISRMNSSPALKVAVDIPSGIDADTGRVLGTAFKADETVTFGYGKVGMYLQPGRSYCGNITVGDIGIYQTAYSSNKAGRGILLERGDLEWLWNKSPQGNKGTFGKVLLVAGSENMCGAAYLNAVSCLRVGAGMVKIVTVPDNKNALFSLLPEALLDTSDSEANWQDDLSWADVVVMGSGLGQSPASQAKVKYFLSSCSILDKPLVLDADALNLLAKNPQWKEHLKGNMILTPHVGEAVRLLRKKVDEIKEDLFGSALELARESGAVCVVKDASTVTISPEGEGYICPGGNPGLATAGSGDVLSGMVGGLLAQARDKGFSTAYIAACAVALHNFAGRLAAMETFGGNLLASDIVKQLQQFPKGGV